MNSLFVAVICICTTSMTTNPSHILIARNSRGLNNPAAALSSPTETHAAASGIFRSTGASPWLFEDCETDDIISELSTEDDDESIEIDETFTKACRFPGTVKIVVESTTFWFGRFNQFHMPLHQFPFICVRAHKEILFFASPFFEAALSGDWSETARPPSVVTISHTASEGSTQQDSIWTKNKDPELEDLEVTLEFDSPKLQDSNENRHISANSPEMQQDSFASTSAAGVELMPQSEAESPSTKKVPAAQAIVRRRTKHGPDALIVLKEEKVRSLSSPIYYRINLIR